MKRGRADQSHNGILDSDTLTNQPAGHTFPSQNTVKAELDGPRHGANMSPRILTKLTSVTIISSPYHVGLRASPIHRSRVSEGPDYIKSAGLISLLDHYSVPINQVEIPPVAGDFEGEIGRTFELLRRVSLAVTAARNTSSFPIVLAGDCCTSVGVAAGLWASDDLKGAEDDALGAVWFDAHDDYNIPDTVVQRVF